MASRRRGRIIAFQALYAWDINERDAASAASFDWLDEDPGTETLSFAQLLVAGTIEAIVEVDEAIRTQLEHWNFDRLARVDLAVLRLGAFCLIHRTEIPARVTIDEAVAIAKEYGSPDSYRFVNGILDGIRKRRDIS